MLWSADKLTYWRHVCY